VKIGLVLVLGGVVLGLVARHAHNRILTGAVALMLSGLLFGFATSFLTFRMRKLASTAFLISAIAASLAILIARTCCGWESKLPLEVVFVPFVFPIAFKLGQAKGNRL
jgi:hypothetical protein